MKTLQFIVIASSLLMCSCKKGPKDQNTIQGKITYVRWSGSEYSGNGATVVLYSGTGISGTREKTTTAGSDGSYTFRDVQNGTHTVYSEATYSTTYYYGQGGASVYGDDNTTVDVKMR